MKIRRNHQKYKNSLIEIFCEEPGYIQKKESSVIKSLKQCENLKKNENFKKKSSRIIGILILKTFE
jgi:hypothetical protein